ncbi:MAG: hypothetical protein AVDCRST_MAG95-1318 [uncultured Adhaeribacter sp.]|uniref:Uncharacterized protein n=1 Tax=uncultured Adhaeribacter sp. TaxID=448109 RepID=A0A6J4I2A0_9BACT|nr:MAG: hypothetical protein AVDCRST_MAG95-1318 [uncultured Adhaeribacter sp.]
MRLFKQIYSTLFFILLLSNVLHLVAQQPLSAEVKMYNGRPAVFLNGVPEYPMIYSLTDVPGGRWAWEELPRYNLQNFCSNGVRLVQVDLAFDHVWKADGSIDTDTAQKQLRGVLDVCPNAAIFIRFHVNPPKWWQQKHPEENTVYADTTPMPDIDWGLQRIIEDDEENPTRHSLASARWKEEATAKLVEFLTKLKTLPEANALAGIQVAGGVYGEWHYWGFINNEPDVSLPMQRYFRTWLKEKYRTDAALQRSWNNKQVTLAMAGLPTLHERRTTQAGIFRLPAGERNVIDYYEAQHQVVADDIIHFCKVVKETWPRPIITGAFYGYYYAVFGRETAGGHLQLQRVLASPYLDYLSAPGAYYPDAREMGDPYRSRGLITSVRLHGKLWLDEMDQQTFLVPLKDTAFKTSLQKSIAQTRRNVLFTFTNGAGLWFYDFGPSGFNGGPRLTDHGSFGWWDEPALMQDIGHLKKLLDSSFRQPYVSGADVLLVHSTETFYYTGSDRAASYMGHWANNWVPPAVFQSGAVHDVVHIDDLDRVAIDQYKAVVFVNTWLLTAAQKNIIQSKVAKNGRHLVWLYSPGYTDGKTVKKEFAEAVTGMKMRLLPQDSTTTVVINSEGEKEYRYNINNKAVNPLLVVQDKGATTLGTIAGTNHTGFARKAQKQYTSWYLALPPAQPALWRSIFRAAGAHIYNDSGDIFYNGSGLLVLHTANGGNRKILLKNGKEVTVALQANSTTVLEAQTGRILLQ